MTSGLKYAENWNLLKYSFGLKREVSWSCSEEVCSEHLKTNTHASPLDTTITIYVKTWKTWSCSQRKLFKWLKMFHVSEIIWQLLCEVTGEKWLWLEPGATSKIWCHHCHRVCVTGEVLSWVIWSYFIALLWHYSWLVISWDSHSTVQCLDNLRKSVLPLLSFSIAKHFKPVLVSINWGATNRIIANVTIVSYLLWIMVSHLQIV